jgi:hypothetical protein
MGIKRCQIQNNGDFGFCRRFAQLSDGFTVPRTLRLVVVIVDQNVGA